MNLPQNQPNLSRQAVRRKMIELAFQDISKQYKEPRRARRAMARAIGKQAWVAYRSTPIDVLQIT